jgi:hypothetical protein
MPRLLSGRAERLIQIGDQVIDMFNADGKANQANI